MITAVLFYEDENDQVLTHRYVADSLDNVDDYFKSFLEQANGVFIHTTYYDSDEGNIYIKMSAE